MSGHSENFSKDRFYLVQRAMKNVEGDNSLVEAQENGWAGLVEYYTMDGTHSDPWGGELTKYKEYNSSLIWIEDELLAGNMLEIYEPCNVASSLEFYLNLVALDDFRPHWKIQTEYVKAVSRVTTYVAFGSVFFHASHTKLGFKTDISSIRLMLFLAYQMLVSNLPQNSVSRQVFDLSPQPRRTAVEMSIQLRDIYRHIPVIRWEEEL